MAIDTALLKWYQCTNWTEAATHGGDINTAATITTNTLNNVFDDITNTERNLGNTDYRKIYFRNENADTFAFSKCWIYSQTPVIGENIYVRQGGTLSRSATSTLVSLYATITNGATSVVFDVAQDDRIVPGEMIWNSGDDAITSAATIFSVSGAQVYLTNNYVGTSGGGDRVIAVASIGHAGVSFYQPASKAAASVLDFGSLAQNAYKAIWIKRTESAGVSGYDNDNFVLACEDATV